MFTELLLTIIFIKSIKKIDNKTKYASLVLSTFYTFGDEDSHSVGYVMSTQIL